MVNCQFLRERLMHTKLDVLPFKDIRKHAYTTARVTSQSGRSKGCMNAKGRASYPEFTVGDKVWYANPFVWRKVSSSAMGKDKRQSKKTTNPLSFFHSLRFGHRKFWSFWSQNQASSHAVYQHLWKCNQSLCKLSSLPIFYSQLYVIIKRKALGMTAPQPQGARIHEVTEIHQ